MRAIAVAPLLLVSTPVWAGEADQVDHTGIGVHVSGSASIDNGAFAADLGLRYAFDEAAILGLDAEYNPWF